MHSFLPADPTRPVRTASGTLVDIRDDGLPASHPRESPHPRLGFFFLSFAIISSTSSLPSV